MTLPLLDDERDTASDCIEEFQTKGHTVIRGLATPAEVAAYRQAIEDAASARNRETRPLEERDTYGKAFLQTPNLWMADDAVKAFVFARRFAKVANDLLGASGIRLYHDQALFKEPRGGKTPWHQDQFYWPLDTERTITMWMPLVDVPAEVGSMTFASGSWHLRDLGGGHISDRSDAAFAAMLEEKGLGRETHGAMQVGDATFHAGWTLHSAPPNPTDLDRPVMTVIYFADGARVTKPSSIFQEGDLKYWLHPRQPGELADGPLNPLLYAPA